MASQYAKYTRPDGDEAVLLADPLSRAAFERKGFTYVEDAEDTPGLEPANPGRNGDLLGVKAGDLDAEAVVQQATDVVMRKISGTWTHAEAAAESGLIRGAMSELGSFPIATLDTPGESAVPTAPLPAPVEPQPGGAVSITGAGGDGTVTDANLQPGAQDLSGVSTAPAGTNWANTTATAGSPGTFSGTTPTLKGELDQIAAPSGGPWAEGQYVRVNSRDYYWDGSAWVTGRAPAAAMV